MNNEYNNSYFLLSSFLNSISLTIPLIILGAPIWIIILATLFCFIPSLTSSIGVFATFSTLYNLLVRPGLYIWALIVAISGEQDIFTIIFYIVATIQIPSILKNILTYVVAFFSDSSK